MARFQAINRAFSSTFQPDQLTLGLVVPIESYGPGQVATLANDVQRVRQADALGFASVWLRDVPFNVPSFGDAGQLYDPFVYLGHLAAKTERIALGVASIVVPLRHPAHIAKAAASVDVLSGGRLLLGVASGDRPEEYPAMNRDFSGRGSSFREGLEYINALAQSYPSVSNEHGALHGDLDMLPKPNGAKLPLLVTGSSQQAPEWVASHGDGWMTYPRDIQTQARVVAEYRQRTEAAGLPPKPVMQSLYIDLVPEADAPPQPIHLGFRSGISALRDYLRALRDIGVNHVALNLRFNQAPIEGTMGSLVEGLFPEFQGGACTAADRSHTER